MRQSKEAALQRLRELADNPAERAAFAATLLQPKLGLEVVRAALRVLVAHPHLPARPALVKLFDHYAEQGVTRDPGTYVRSEIVRALRRIAEVADIDLLERALLTYEFPAPAFKEEAALLRSGALVTLAELDDVRARFHATRLLADPGLMGRFPRAWQDPPPESVPSAPVRSALRWQCQAAPCRRRR